MKVPNYQNKAQLPKPAIKIRGVVRVLKLNDTDWEFVIKKPKIRNQKKEGEPCQE